MEENYILYVKGVQTVDGESQTAETKTKASYITRNGTRYISYIEHDDDDINIKQRVTVKVTEQGVVTILKGSSGGLVLEKGGRHNCRYPTPFGYLMLGVYTDKLHSRFDDNGGELEASYTLEVDSAVASKNKLFLNIKEVNQNE